MARFWHLALASFAFSLLGGAVWCPPLGQQPDRSVATLFRVAQQDASAGRFDQAVKEYQEVLRHDPTLVEARFNLALAYHSLGDYVNAIRELEKVVGERPDLVGANLFLGIDYIRAKLPREALAPLKAVLRADPENRMARKALATTHVALESYRQALTEFRALASSDPDPANGLYELGQCYLDLARKLANHLSEVAPNSAWSNRLGGDLRAASGQWTDAAILYHRALAADPRQPGLHTSLGNTDLHQGKLAQAEAEFQAELRFDAGDTRALRGLAEGDLASGAPLKALETLSKIGGVPVASLDLQRDFPSVTLTPEIARREATEVEACPDSLWKRFLLASLYRLAGEEDRSRQHWEAWNRDSVIPKETEKGSAQKATEPCRAHDYATCVKDLQSARNLDTSDRFMLGYALFSLGEFQESADTFADTLSSAQADLQTRYWLAQDYLRLAEACFSQLIREFPESWRAHEFGAISSQLRYSSDEAIKEFQTAIQLNPNDPGLHQKLGELFYTHKSYLQAEEEFRKALQLDSGEARSLYLLGHIRLEQHQANESIPYFLSALRYNPDLMEAHAALGQAYMRLGQPKRAVPELTKASSIDTYGDLHYLLYVAYRKLGKTDLAQQALARSQALRKSTAATHQAKVDEVAGEEARQ